jgi:CRP-like cAMP-binding protein
MPLWVDTGKGETMGAPIHDSKKFNGQEILRDLIPLNALGEDRFREIATSLSIQDVSSGRYLFGEGDRDNRSIFLLDGVINFLDRNGKVTGVISAGTDPARYPLANRQPRMVTARAATKSVIASIDSTLLDVMLTLDQSTITGSVNIGAHSEQDWMTRMLQSDAFAKLSPSDIQRLIQALEPVPYSAGDTVIRQGDEGDYFYIIREGTCSVTRLASGKGWDVPLAELGAGDCFGEDALVSDGRRNATVTMLTDGALMRLSKLQFLDILKKQLVHYVSYDLALDATRSGDRWLDVRLAEEHANGALKDSISIPLSAIRANTSRLDLETRYIVYCDTGRRSAAAAFLLTQRGFDVAVLEGGLNENVPGKDYGQSNEPATATDAPENKSNAGVTPLHPDPWGSHAASEDARENRRHSDEIKSELTALRAEVRAYAERASQLETACKLEHHARENLLAKIEAMLGRLK